MTKGQRKKQKRMRQKLEKASVLLFSKKRMKLVRVCIMKSIRS